MAVRTYETTETVSGGGNFLDVPGVYMCHVLDVLDGKGPKGNALNGFTVEMEVLSGTPGGQEEKKTHVTFFDGKLTDKDQGEFARKKQTAFFVATGLLKPDQLGKPIPIDPEHAKGRMIIIKLVKSDRSEGEKVYLELNFTDIYHVDDPRAPKCDRREDTLALIPTSLRHDAAYFEPLKRNPTGNGAAKPATGLSQSQLDTL